MVVHPRAELGRMAERVEMDAHVNDDEFAIAAAQKLIDLMNQ